MDANATCVFKLPRIVLTTRKPVLYKSQPVHQAVTMKLKVFLSACRPLRDEWTEAIQMVADKLQRQEEERIQCSPTSNIDNMVEEEMDISTTHHKRKVTVKTGTIPAARYCLLAI